MNFELLHNIELECIRFIHEFRSPSLDSFIKLFNFFDRQEFFFILIPIIWFGNSWKAGLRLFYFLLISVVINHTLKDFFALPRPLQLDSSLGILQINGYGLPSGAAQSAVLLSGILLNWKKNFWTVCVAILYVFSVSFSRIYLGVHFPSDILAGWFIGVLLFLLYAYGVPSIEKRLERFRPFSLLLISQLIPLALLGWQPAPTIVRMTSIAMGMGLGLFINHFYRLSLPLPQNTKEYVLRVVIGVVGTFLFYELSRVITFENMMATQLLRFFLLAVWITFGCNWICRTFLLKTRSFTSTL